MAVGPSDTPTKERISCQPSTTTKGGGKGQVMDRLRENLIFIDVSCLMVASSFVLGRQDYLATASNYAL